MKFSNLSISVLAGFAAAVPTPTIEQEASRAQIAKRAAINDVAFGFASLNGGTNGGAGGTTVTVTNYAQFTAAVSATPGAKKVVIVNGLITANAKQVNITSNTSVIGKNSGAKFLGVGLLVKNANNVIIRNIAVSKVIADNGDAIGIQYATNVWVDHVDLSSDKTHGKDYYDGALDITHAGDFVTVSHSYIHDHYKGSLVGHSDNNGAEDRGHLRVTYANNYWKGLNSRAPSLRFGTGHIYNSYFEDTWDCVNTRLGAQVLVESNKFVGSKKPIFSQDNDAGAVSVDNDFGDRGNTAPAGTLRTVPYPYTKVGSGNVQAAVVGSSGNTLSF